MPRVSKINPQDGLEVLRRVARQEITAGEAAALWGLRREAFAQWVFRHTGKTILDHQRAAVPRLDLKAAFGAGGRSRP